MISDTELLEHATTTAELIELHTSGTIWRTSIRIYELIRLNYPLWRENEILIDEVKFAAVLTSMCQKDGLNAINAQLLEGERYEEGHHEPTMLGDTQSPGQTYHISEKVRKIVPPFQRINVRAIIVQRELHRLMKAGLNYNEAYDLVHKLHPKIRDAYVTEFRTKGMGKGNIFYRKPHNSSVPTTKELDSEYA